MTSPLRHRNALTEKAWEVASTGSMAEVGNFRAASILFFDISLIISVKFSVHVYLVDFLKRS